jgi:hypothetical protein
MTRLIDLYSVQISPTEGPSVQITARHVNVRPDGLLEVRGIRGPKASEGQWESFQVTRIPGRVEDGNS